MDGSGENKGWNGQGWGQPMNGLNGGTFLPVSLWTPAQVALNQQLRALWEQHIFWTRLTVNSIAGRLPDEAPTTARLLENAADFGRVFAAYYGPVVAGRFAELLRGHLTIAAELVAALRDGRTEAARDAERRWYRNAEDIAAFLARINPFWSRVWWRSMLFEHLRLLTEEVSTRIAGDYERNVATNRRVEQQALEMADAMSAGIVRQFPAAFR
jgi:hypothetical protein